MVATACGGKGGGGGSLIDAPPLAPDARDVDAGPHTNDVTVSVFGDTPSFAAYYSTSTGAWHTATVSTTAQGQAIVVETADTDAVELVAVCVDGDGDSDLAQLDFAYPADAQFQSISCVVGGGPPPATVAVTGAMNQTGTIWLQGNTATSATAPWSYTVNVPPSTYDLVATGSNAMEIYRDLGIAVATTGPTINLTASGTPYEPIAATITNLGIDTQTNDVNLLTANGFAEIESTGAAIVGPPAALVVGSDIVQLNVLASGPGYFREVEGEPGDPSFALPDRLTGVTFGTADGTTRATWSALPATDIDQVELDLYAQSNGVTQYATVVTSSAWLTATGATALAPDGAAPGFQASWLPPAATTIGQQLETIGLGPQTSLSGVYTTSGTGGAGGLRAPHRAHGFSRRGRWYAGRHS